MRTALVLLPGLLNDAALWAHQAETLSDAVDVVIPDLTRGETISEMADHVLEQTPSIFALAGLSMGGYVAMDIMRRAPERVSRLALIDTSPHPDTEDQTRRRKGFIRLSRTGRFRGVTRQLLPQLVYPPNAENESLAESVFEMAERLGRDVFIRQQNAIMAREDSLGDLEGYPCPTVVVCGRHDQLTPVAVHEDMASRIPNATLVVVEESGHLSPLEQPQAVSATLRYWLNS